ncbi:proline dehydrogenase [Haloferax mediterranei ATCC 33500]|uniref:proline dehydrogenase n=1 Tax=Haloferax mediterranei (strain ATCC 33500 / DSM 1411 / JCM 8866 / NBRC 14739 / NCIMB 2177 / R-4) TaxID=523841 RepID=I3R1E5_HALMT|nr:proline dehydrogenase family protein [Haloferax mediterranei]AFK18055.1 proline dehydrogenase [Haloferax mediterranei ATCC 33500]AHZ22532.1 proline dehydrogenase [Haloferax mediterranei ATCC 33500]EMA02669.1 proline dehydrogenase [Haloferax mediterranei ATCC 33500]MDX5988148.1 proline dehydrogenase family protein [Haloferax mediterranei ATCC 33500]QCQ74595.1 proline dehydrogenase [Haloferax mediterranei ATCC 33500]
MIPPIASKFVAGESAAGALDHARQMNEDGVAVILNLLGEHYHERGPADEDADAYIQLVEDIASSDLDACVSVKPSQIGLDVGDDVFVENYRRIAAAADDHGVFLWCDMEDHETTDVTLDAFEELAREFGGGMGLCVQANLKRTPDDLERLADVPGKIRLVKGAYDEPASIAHKKKSKIDEVYKELLAYLFREYEGGIAVGSHDPEMIDYARELSAEYDRDYEIQMLMGVREDAQRELAAEGIEVWQYAPYGGKWFSYFYRRVRERKENALFALRAVVGI